MPNKLLELITSQGALDTAALGTSTIPVVGEATGFIADAANMIRNPDQRTLANVGLMAAGVVPGLPSGGTVKRAASRVANMPFREFQREVIGISHKFKKLDGKSSAPIHLKDGSRISGFTDNSGQAVYGFDSKGRRFSMKVESLDPKDIKSGPDSSINQVMGRKKRVEEINEKLKAGLISDGESFNMLYNIE